jgi:hypothetical protein
MRRHWKKLTIAFVIIILGAGFVTYGVVEPQTTVGYVVFRSAYLFPPTRPSFLRFLNDSLRENNGGYVPSAIDQFLIDRLWQCKGSAEWQTIVDFEVRQTSARWGSALWFSENEQGKGSVIAYLIANLDKYSAEDAASAMVLIEALRRNEQLIKHDINIHYWDEEHQMYVWPQDKRAQATKLFRRWWGDGHQWPNNRSQNPLEGSGFEIYWWAG